LKLKLSADVIALNPGAGQAITVERDTAARKKARLPRAPASAPTGITALVAERGWSVESDGHWFRLYQLRNRAFDTGRCASEREACEAARGMEKEAQCRQHTGNK
jgi:hypothetical protein